MTFILQRFSYVKASKVLIKAWLAISFLISLTSGSTFLVSTASPQARLNSRVSVQGVKSLGGHFACLCRGFEFYEVKKIIFSYYFSKRKWKYFYTFYHFYSEKSSKRAK